ncbi:hypothetical protein DFH05DRAFT_1025369 [Lentinula detonsa]|uniref:Uncharacterized protein n=1 Tax=Lentinula detonsa TaxID=2804962 RepID=A0A9W8P2E6_9AGAR|nr:hypothetical protein DFH05DRAFT_1025369 [Lentinula detonsa]
MKRMKRKKTTAIQDLATALNPGPDFDVVNDHDDYNDTKGSKVNRNYPKLNGKGRRNKKRERVLRLLRLQLWLRLLLRFQPRLLPSEPEVMSSVALLIHSFLSFCFVDSSLPSVLFVHSLALLYSFAPFRFVLLFICSLVLLCFTNENIFSPSSL